MQKLAEFRIIDISAILIRGKRLRQRIKIAIKILGRITAINVLVLGIGIARLNKLFSKTGRRKGAAIKLLNEVAETIDRRIKLETSIVLDQVINKITISRIIRNGRSVF